MSSTTKLLRAYLRAVRTASGASSATLYVPPSDGVSTVELLIHDGDEPAVPELASASAAGALEAQRPVAAPPDGSPWVKPASIPGGWLIRVSSSGRNDAGEVAGSSSRSRRRGRDQGDREPTRGGSSIWIGLRMDTDNVADRSGPPGGGPHSWESLLQVGNLLGAHAHVVSSVLDDRLTGLPGRPEFQRRADAAMARMQTGFGAIAVLMVNPDAFGSINEKFGPRRGDEVIRQVTDALAHATRADDFVARYGGAMFLVLLEEIDPEAPAPPWERVLRAVSEAVRLDDSFQLTLSAGIARVEPREAAGLCGSDLIRRAEQALKMAKCVGGGCVRMWDPAYEQGTPSVLEGLDGVITGNPAKDYRNMRLLSQIVGAIAAGGSFDKLATAIVQRVGETFQADRVVLVDWSGGNDHTRQFEFAPAKPVTDASRRPDVELGPEITVLLERVRATGRSVVWDGAPGTPPRYAIPLVAGESSLGCLYLDGGESGARLEAGDVDFVNALAVQISMALDRTRLTQLERSARVAERDRLRAELEQIRQATRKSSLAAQSPQMTRLLEQARRVAMTDATVLIHGESGTGKELLSRALHELSDRSDRPLVVVDCAAIPATLIESELFGHEKGAFTGAQQQKIGRLAEADRGTVFLDEIGELPLEVQGKLLRFVQEKQLSRVGSSQYRKVDVRVLAATNRDLARESAEGRFREDLFHRLNVIRLEVPPLRDRPEDVELLIEQFLRQFSEQYHDGAVRRLSAAASAALLAHRWPGNVRELRNAIMRAVILSHDDVIDLDQFEIGTEEAGRRHVATPGGVREELVAEIASPPPSDPETTWARIDAALARVVDAALRDRAVDLAPIGAWLVEDLVLEAHNAAGGVATRAADLLAIPEATFRRKYKKAKGRTVDRVARRSESWNSVAPLLRELIRPAVPADLDVLRRARDTLLSVVKWRVGDHRADGAALMGVSPPTYRRWLQDLPAETTPRASAAGSG